MKFLKRGQAAMEFLTTYGWAILVIVLVLAALIWLGVFNVQSKIPESCTFDSTLQCGSMRLIAGSSSGSVMLAELVVIPRTNQDVKVCDVEVRTGNVPQSVPDSCFTDASKPRVPSGNEIRINYLGGLNFRGVSSNALPMLFSFPFPDFSKMLFKDGDTDQALVGYKKGERFTGNVFLYYSLEGDLGKARVWRGEVSGTLQ